MPSAAATVNCRAEVRPAARCGAPATASAAAIALAANVVVHAPTWRNALSELLQDSQNRHQGAAVSLEAIQVQKAGLYPGTKQSASPGMFLSMSA